ncbi:hypothetical protein CEXT_754521 [Caerostris extrusa]|uniref:Uncharacterized protein n=1 Tax=Caerostris extrusa TaxID=172846 RepID=A0AAV4NSI1_CAEEX|nr:hypothetical protein CEXT_754521 [Caerostris extrusa]
MRSSWYPHGHGIHGPLRTSFSCAPTPGGGPRVGGPGKGVCVRRQRRKLNTSLRNRALPLTPGPISRSILLLLAYWTSPNGSDQKEWIRTLKEDVYERECLPILELVRGRVGTSVCPLHTSGTDASQI